MHKIHSTLLSNKDDFIFNLLEIENFNSQSSRLRYWFSHLEKNIQILEDSNGDLFEFGVFRGKSLIAMAFLLKKLKSSRKIYGFDSFAGFPRIDKNDEFASFDLNSDIFDDQLLDRHKLLLHILSIKNKLDFLPKSTPINISNELNFSRTSEFFLRDKIEQLELDNIELIVGNFADTVPDFFNAGKFKIFSANIDCDLYDGYKALLPYLYDSLIEGGFIHLDEYYSLKFPGARIACNEFFKSRNIYPTRFHSYEWEFERWGLLKPNTKNEISS